MTDALRQAAAIRADEQWAFRRSFEREVDGAMASFSDQLARSWWGDTAPSYPVVKVSRWRRLWWKRHDVRRAVASAALWLLRTDPRELVDD